ncbi:hypothetical protein KM043_018503 [Ampulex compressa]|nr:hypothetical protein KM043_018503 [Ampulex compressa]
MRKFKRLLPKYRESQTIGTDVEGGGAVQKIPQSPWTHPITPRAPRSSQISLAATTAGKFAFSISSTAGEDKSAKLLGRDSRANHTSALLRNSFPNWLLLLENSSTEDPVDDVRIYGGKFPFDKSRTKRAGAIDSYSQ